jgi:hypothetical protein
MPGKQSTGAKCRKHVSTRAAREAVNEKLAVIAIAEAQRRRTGV